MVRVRPKSGVGLWIVGFENSYLRLSAFIGGSLFYHPFSNESVVIPSETKNLNGIGRETAIGRYH